tara:strand:+ start:17617 stop:18228 length:612 start_codon:yes stop_codon:yes gene_type:complete
MASNHKIGGILLSAGLSSRMHSHKALLSWGSESLIRYQVTTLLGAGVDEVIVVLGHDEEKLRAQIKDMDNVIGVTNQDYLEGKTTSLKVGVRIVEARDCSDVLILNVDQPRSPRVIKDIIRFHLNNDKGITIPRYNLRGGHPIIICKQYFSSIMSIKEETQGLKQVMSDFNQDIAYYDTTDSEILIDMNSEEQYISAKAFFEI